MPYNASPSASASSFDDPVLTSSSTSAATAGPTATTSTTAFPLSSLPATLPPLPPPPPPSSVPQCINATSFLSVGRVFSGRQTVKKATMSTALDPILAPRANLNSSRNNNNNNNNNRPTSVNNNSSNNHQSLNVTVSVHPNTTITSPAAVAPIARSHNNNSSTNNNNNNNNNTSTSTTTTTTTTATMANSPAPRSNLGTSLRTATVNATISARPTRPPSNNGANTGIGGAPAMTSREPNEWRVNVVIQGVDLANGTVCGSMEALDVPQAEGPVITFWTGEIIDNVNNFFRTRRWIVPYDKDMQHWGCFVAFSDLIEQLGPEENANDIIYDDDDNDNDDMDTTTTASNAPLQLDSLEQNAPQRRSTSVERQQGGGQRARAAQQQEGRQQTGIVSPDSVNLSHHRYIFMRWKELFFVSPKGECGLTIAGFYYMCMDRHTGAILGFYHDPYCAPFQQLQLNAVSTRTGFAHADYSFN